MNLKKISVRPVFARYEKGSESIKKNADLLRQAISIHAQLLEPVLVDKDYTGAPAEAFILYPGHIGCGEIVEHLRQRGDVLLFAGDEPWAALDAAEGLSAMEGVHLVLDYAEVKEKALGLSVRKTLRETRILAVVPDMESYPGLLEKRYDLHELEARLGIAVDLRPKEHLIPYFDSAGAEMARVWIEGAVETGADEGEIKRTARLYEGLRRFIESEGYDAVAISCNAPRMGDFYVPCIALGQLRDNGIPAACEADIASLVGMILVDLATGKPSFMGNLVGFDDRTITLSHCAMPFLIAGDKAQYSLADYHGGRWPGATARVFLPEGEAITVLRVSGRWDEAIVAEGTFLRQEDHGCRNTLRIEISDPKGLIRKTSGNHHIVFFGLGPELPRLLDFLGFRVKTL
jgi:L-fucose isomerase-like protein